MQQIYEKDNKAAGVRLRKGLQAVRVMSQDLRLVCHLKIKNNMLVLLIDKVLLMLMFAVAVVTARHAYYHSSICLFNGRRPC
jgi:hypothetical protein